MDESSPTSDGAGAATPANPCHPPIQSKPSPLPDPDWRCAKCSGSAFAPDGLRFKKKVWTLGTVSTKAAGDQQGHDFDVLLRLDRNAKIPCLELMLYARRGAGEQDESCKKKPDAYVLVEVGSSSSRSENNDEASPEQESLLTSPELFLRGVHLSEKWRQRGLSTLLVSLFVRFCKLVNAETCGTRKMDKPLLSLALQKLGFLATRTTVACDVVVRKRAGPDSSSNPATASITTLVQDSAGGAGIGRAAGTGPSPGALCRARTDVIRISTARNERQVRSMFALSYLKTQNIELIPECPVGCEVRAAYVNTPFLLWGGGSSPGGGGGGAGSSAPRPAPPREDLLDLDKQQDNGICLDGFCPACFSLTVVEQCLHAWLLRSGGGEFVPG